MAGAMDGRSIWCSGYGNMFCYDKMALPVFYVQKESVPEGLKYLVHEL